MKRLLIGLVAMLAVSDQSPATTNVVSNKSVVAVNVPNPNDPLEKEYQKLLADDDAAQAEVDKWIRDNKAFAEQGAGLSSAALNQRIKERFAPIRKAYEEFLQRHPDHAHAR